MAEGKKPEKAESDTEGHKEALERYQRAYDREKDNIDEAYEDLRFRRGRPEDQWPAEELNKRRGKRPILTVNQIPQFIRQVTGDIRQIRPSIKVVPVDSNADPEVAEIESGMIRYIENRSKAKHIYTTAADSQVACGIGHWQIVTEYAQTNTFNQEIRIAGIEDGVAVLWDPDASDPTKADAQFCFVPTDMSRAAFEKRWPGKVPSELLSGDTAFRNWVTDDFIRVVAYWVKKPIKRTLVLFPDGAIDDITDQVDEMPREVAAWYQQQGARIEERDSYKVCRYLMSATEFLEGPSDWPGMHIPIVPVIGEEVRIGRELYRHGVVRYLRDPQRMANYYDSAATEVIALQPKAPFIGTDKMFEAHLDFWESANTENFPYLPYTPDTKAPGAKPERMPPPVGSTGIQEGLVRSVESMYRVTGIYPSALGAKSNETSGKAIEARKVEGDVGTFVYIDNFSLAVQRTGEIIVDLIPHIYDTERRVRIVGEDGRERLEAINKTTMVGGQEKVQFDVTVGAYDVVVETGPSYSTKRQQARESMTEFVRAVPQAAAVSGDLIAKMQDWPYAEDFGERLEMILPPEIQAKLKEKKREDEQGQQPTPEEMQEMQAQQAQQQMQQQMLQMQMAQAEAATRKAIADAEKAEAEAQEARAKAQGVDPLAERKLEADLQLERERFEFDKQLKLMDHELKMREADQKLAIDRENAAQQMQMDRESHVRQAENDERKMTMAKQKEKV